MMIQETLRPFSASLRHRLRRVYAFNADRADETDVGIRAAEHRSRYELAARYVRGQRVLDLACGTGWGSRIYARNGAALVLAADISLHTLENFEHGENHHNIRRCCMDATRMGLRDQSQDLIISFETLEHLEQMDAFLEEMRRVLKKEGKLIISTPNRATYGGGLATPFNPSHRRELELNEFRDMLERHGFEIDELLGQDFDEKGRKIHERRTWLVRNPFTRMMITRIYYPGMAILPSVVYRLINTFVLRDPYRHDAPIEVFFRAESLEKAYYFVAFCHPRLDRNVARDTDQPESRVTAYGSNVPSHPVLSHSETMNV